MHQGLDTDTHVFFYEQDFYVLSNFSAFGIWYEGIFFQTSEHLYHWFKFCDVRKVGARENAQAIIQMTSAHDALKYAQAWKHNRRDDWDDVKDDIMRQVLMLKVQQHEYVRRKLLQTGDRILVENSWRDDYWGWGPNKDGQNILGQLWMEIRQELRKWLTTANS